MNSKRKLSKVAKLLILGFFVIVFAFLSYMFLNRSHILDEVVPRYYTETSFLDYRVCLKENDRYPDECLGKDTNNYIASLINYLDINFNYSYVIDDVVDASYNYYIDAEVKVFDKTNPSKIIYSDVKHIVESKSFNVSKTKKFDIIENVKINYGDYNDDIRSFKADYNLVANSDITLKLYVQNSSASDKYEKPIENKAVMSVVIPLTENRIDIATEYKDINNKVVINPNDKVVGNRLFVVIAVLFAVAGVANLAVAVYVLFQTKDKKSGYEKYIAKLLREFDDIITESVTLIDEEAYEIYDVKTFGELKNISDRLERQILFTEGTLTSGVKRTWFSLIDNDILYRVVIRSDDFE